MNIALFVYILAQLRYKDRLIRYGHSDYKDKIINRLSYDYNRNPYVGGLMFFKWNVLLYPIRIYLPTLRLFA